MYTLYLPGYPSYVHPVVYILWYTLWYAPYGTPYGTPWLYAGYEAHRALSDPKIRRKMRRIELSFSPCLMGK